MAPAARQALLAENGAVNSDCSSLSPSAIKNSDAESREASQYWQHSTTKRDTDFASATSPVSVLPPYLPPQGAGFWEEEDSPSPGLPRSPAEPQQCGQSATTPSPTPLRLGDESAPAALASHPRPTWDGTRLLKTLPSHSLSDADWVADLVALVDGEKQHGGKPEAQCLCLPAAAQKHEPLCRRETLSMVVEEGELGPLDSNILCSCPAAAPTMAREARASNKKFGRQLFRAKRFVLQVVSQMNLI